MAEEDALQLVRMRNDFYRDNYRRVLSILLLMIIINLGLVGVVFYQMSTKPKAKYFATSADGRITPLQPLTQPLVSVSALLQWANQAAVSAYTYDFVNYRKQIQDSSEYFTPQGWRNFEAALKSSRNLETVIARKLVVTAVATGAPVVLDQRVIAGRYAWKVQMPLLVTYQSASTLYQQPLTVTMIIARVSMRDVPKGIAIAQFYASEGATSRV